MTDKYTIDEKIESFKRFSRKAISTILAGSIGILPLNGALASTNINPSRYLILGSDCDGNYWDIEYIPNTGTLTYQGENINKYTITDSNFINQILNHRNNWTTKSKNSDEVIYTTFNYDIKVIPGSKGKIEIYRCDTNRSPISVFPYGRKETTTKKTETYTTYPTQSLTTPKKSKTIASSQDTTKRILTAKIAESKRVKEKTLGIQPQDSSLVTLDLNKYQFPYDFEVKPKPVNLKTEKITISNEVNVLNAVNSATLDSLEKAIIQENFERMVSNNRGLLSYKTSTDPRVINHKTSSIDIPEQVRVPPLDLSLIAFEKETQRAYLDITTINKIIAEDFEKKEELRKKSTWPWIVGSSLAGIVIGSLLNGKESKSSSRHVDGQQETGMK